MPGPGFSLLEWEVTEFQEEGSPAPCVWMCPKLQGRARLLGKYCREAALLYLLLALLDHSWVPTNALQQRVWAEPLLLSGMKLWRGWDLWELRRLWISLQLPSPNHSPYSLDVKHVFNLKTVTLTSKPVGLFCLKFPRWLQTDLARRCAQHFAGKSLLPVTTIDLEIAWEPGSLPLSCSSTVWVAQWTWAEGLLRGRCREGPWSYLEAEEFRSQERDSCRTCMGPTSLPLSGHTDNSSSTWSTASLHTRTSGFPLAHLAAVWPWRSHMGLLSKKWLNAFPTVFQL